MKNPFPGMHPWLEEYWRDVHARILVNASEQLNERLPEDLRARVDERPAFDADEAKPRTYVPDVAITEPWDRAARPVLGQSGLSVTVAEPVVVDLGQQIVRRLEIVDSREHIVTAIELASPSNKSVGEACAAWRRKRYDYLAAGINVVEIDLLPGALLFHCLARYGGAGFRAEPPVVFVRARLRVSHRDAGTAGCGVAGGGRG